MRPKAYKCSLHHAADIFLPLQIAAQGDRPSGAEGVDLGYGIEDSAGHPAFVLVYGAGSDDDIGAFTGVRRERSLYRSLYCFR